MGENGRLREYFFSKKGKKIYKWVHYLDIYEKHFERFRDKDVNLLEIGVYTGGSLEMWRDYFGGNSRIYGMDIEEDCKKHESGNTRVFVGDQSDEGFLKQCLSRTGRLDIVIDDGGHRVNEQLVSFETIFPTLAPDGVYIVEDTHTNYWPSYGGGFGRETFIEHSKKLADLLAA
jgi:hypothetical protein